MPQYNNVNNLIINQLTKVKYQELVENNQLSNNELYIITDEFHYTEDEIITLLQNKQDVLSNGEGILISGNTISIDLNVLYKKDDIDALLSSKANLPETAYKLIYENNGLTLKNKEDEILSVVDLYELPDIDRKTISYNEKGNLQAIGERIKSGTIKYTWIGTQEEYEQAKVGNVIDEFTEVLITDSVSETVTPIVHYDAPTKLSELANDMNFVVQSDLQSVKDELQSDIEAGIDDTNLVHKTGNETIEGFKNFKEKIVIENGLDKGRIAHKPVGTSLEDGYIEFGEDTLLYGKQNINGELYDEKHNIFHDGNLTAGDNITITNEDGIYKINSGSGLELCDTDVVIRNDEKIFNQLQQMRHSTFDKSKFTFVGSPTITDDGVASGFAVGSYVNVPILDLSSGDFEVDVTFNFIPMNRNQIIYRCATNNYAGAFGFLIATTTDGKFYLSGSDKDVVTNITLTQATYKAKLKVKNQIAYVYLNDNLVIETPFTKSITNGYLSFGYGTDASLFAGSINLPSISITVDGEEVFTGNKTGLDVIKPDNYTVVGSPVISNDGVASGFSGNDYLTVNTTGFFNNNYNFEIDSKVKFTEDTTTEQELWHFSWIFRCRIWYTNNKHRLDFYMPYASNYTNTSAYLEDYGFVDGDDLYIKCISENASSRKLMFSKDGINWNTITNTNTTDKDITSNNLLKIGQYNPTIYWLTNIDLNAFKIYVGGNLVYQPCLKIPYTQSKTGSKIVDVAYRDRVIDLYEQEGQAGYYTIDEPNKNFTLPMGEIYGMIGQRSLISSTVTETNRVDIYSDKTCLICGSVATAGTINLPIELVNNNYFITLSTSAKTATSFTTTSVGDYILIGKVI